jgi:DnaJ-domain-containing protein 1
MRGALDARWYVEEIAEVNDRISTLREPLFVEEVMVATQLVRGHITVEVPDKHSSDMPD